MCENKITNWYNILFNVEFQNHLDHFNRNEVSMVSKLARKNLMQLVFERVVVHSKNINLYSRVFYNSINSQEYCLEYDNHTFRDENGDDIDRSFNEINVALQDINIYTKILRLTRIYNVGYYLFPIVNSFKNLTDLKISYCDIPLSTFSNIGKSLPNLIHITLERAGLVKSPTDILCSRDIIFPPNLKSLIINYIQIVVTNVLPDPYKYLFSKIENNSYESFILPKVSLPYLKKLQYIPLKSFSDIDANCEFEEFLYLNRNLEYLVTLYYNLKMNRFLKSLKYLHVYDPISFNSIENASTLDSINIILFKIGNFENTEKFRRLCMLCPNLVKICLIYIGSDRNSQAFIDNFLTPALPNLTKLKTLRFSNISNAESNLIFDFTKFAQIEKLEMMSCGSILNIKFSNCKSLKQVEFVFPDEEITDEFMNNFKHEGWNFKYDDFEVLGNKI